MPVLTLRQYLLIQITQLKEKEQHSFEIEKRTDKFIYC